MEPKKPIVFRGLCRECNCHLPPEKIPPELPCPYPPSEPYAPPELLKKKVKRDEPESEESETEKAESEEESEINEEKEMHEKLYEVSKKKWEIIEEKELLKLKEEELELDEKESDIFVKKYELKKIEKEIKEKKAKLKEMYVKQLNLESIDGIDEPEKAKEEYELEMEIEFIESELELLKSRGNGLELMISDARRKIMAGREKLAKKKSDMKVAKEIREKEMKEEEEGKWPGEPRWII